MGPGIPENDKHPTPPPEGLYLEIAFKYKLKIKAKQNGKFPSNYKACPIGPDLKQVGPD